MRLRHKWQLLAGVLAIGLVTAGCSSGGARGAGTDQLKVGLIASLSGAYQSVGEELQAGFELYLELNDSQLGGREVEVVIVDEGTGAADARPAAERLIRQERVDVLTGIVSSDSFQAIYELAVQHEVPVVGSNARPASLWDTGIDWMWTTSWLNPQSGTAVAPYIYENLEGPVWAIGPDYEAGYDVVGGFTEPYTSLGGQLANPNGEATFVPFPETNNFVPYLTEIAASDAAMIYAFFGGVQAIDFVTQWAQSPAADLPLYGVGLTEGALLDAQGAAAEGVHSVFNYSPDLEHPANRTFVTEWSARYDRTPTGFAVASYDAAQVLDLAVGAIDGEVTAAAIRDAVAGVGQVDSPRGPWQFSRDTHSPVQRWYLRGVVFDGTEWTNVVVEELATVRD